VKSPNRPRAKNAKGTRRRKQDGVDAKAISSTSWNKREETRRAKKGKQSLMGVTLLIKGTLRRGGSADLNAAGACRRKGSDSTRKRSTFYSCTHHITQGLQKKRRSSSKGRRGGRGGIPAKLRQKRMKRAGGGRRREGLR